MAWAPTITVSGHIRRVLAKEYLEARSAAFDRRANMDPAVADFLNQPGEEEQDVRIWLAFMAGSDWERSYRGRRYTDDPYTVAF